MEAGALDLRAMQRAMSYCLPASQGVLFISDMAAGLSYIHQCAVIHRDLKPQNVILCWATFAPGRLVCKIADFGCSRLESSRITQTVGFCTAWYRAPEAFQAVTLQYKPGATQQAGGSAPAAGEAALSSDGFPRELQPEDADMQVLRARYSFGSDLWSLGCIFAEFLHGKILFQTEFATEVGLLGTIAARIGVPPADSPVSIPAWPGEKLKAAAQAVVTHTV